MWKKGCFSNPAACSCKNGKYARSIICDSVIMCDEMIEEIETIPTKSTSRKTVLTKCTSTKSIPTKPF